MGITEFINQKTDLFKYSPSTIESIKMAADELEVVFSDEYIKYVMMFGVAIFDGHELTGLCDGKRLDVVRNTVEQRRLNPFVPKTWYVIECLDIDGIVIWQDKVGKIHQTFPNGVINFISDSLVEYLQNY